MSPPDDAYGGIHDGHVGKYLNGYGVNHVVEPDSPLPPYDPRYEPPGWDDWQALVDTTTYQVYDYVIQGKRWREVWQWSIRPAPRHEGSVTLGLLPALKPSFNEPDLSHKPIWRPQLDAENLLGIPGTARGGLLKQYRSRLESLRAVDDLVRRVFRTLRAAGRLANTVVLFTSDNGFLYGEHRLAEKLSAYEESIRELTPRVTRLASVLFAACAPASSQEHRPLRPPPRAAMPTWDCT